jgi:coenzyme F420-0:L-glutamate ligase/coenzyme F420-1:gamma-L-glutamate ligase
MSEGISIIGIQGLPEVRPGDDLGALIALHAARRGGLRDGDVVVVAQKVVSKAEGRLRDLRRVKPGEVARGYAERLGHDPRFVQVVLEESVRVVRAERVLITETRHGFVCANAGVDHSNVPGQEVVCLLPEDCDRSAAQLRMRLRELTGRETAVIVADTFGRPWRTGIVNVALGVAGLAPLIDYRGRPDDHGREMRATVVAVADELAAAGELVMRKTARVPVAVIRGWHAEAPPGRGRDLIRPSELDLFR